MKQFYECTMKHNLLASKSTKDWIEFDINTLIRDEAIMIGECDDSLDDISDEEFAVWVDNKAKEIKDELMRNGIYYNEFGQPRFLYC